MNVLPVVATFSTSTPGDRGADDRAGVGHPVVVVGVEHAAVQRCRPQAEPVVVLGDVRPESAELGRERGEPVGLVAAEVRDAAQHAGCLGQCAQGGDRGRELADVVQVDVETVEAVVAVAGPVT